VIAHQHIGVEAPAGLAAGLAERFQKAQAVPVIPIDRPSLIAPRHHVIRGSAIFNAQRPGHNERNIPAPLVPSQDPFTSFLGLTLFIRQLAVQAEAQARAVKAARRARELATQRYRSGLVAYLEVVDASRDALTAERANAQLAGQRLVTSVQLIKALGGGWTTEELAGQRVAANNSAKKMLAQSN
jgi:hypothetical protein